MNSSRFNESIGENFTLKATAIFVEVFVICYAGPVISIFGLLGNILIILIIPRKCIQINSISRMFYFAIAVGDIGTLIFWHIREFLSKGLYILSAGQIFLNIYSDPSCKVLHTLDFLFFPLSLYGMVAFSIERNFALYFPIEHKLFMTLKKALLLLFVTVGPSWLFMIPLSILLTSNMQGDIP